MKPVRDISSRAALWLAVLVIIGSVFLRVSAIETTPPGLAFDATWDLADGLRISRGITFPADFDTRSEPAHRWMIAAAFVLFGTSPFAAQVLQLIIAIFTVALTYAAALALLRGRNWRRLGALVAVGVMSANVAHIFISRIAYHAALVAPVAMLTFVLLMRAARTSQSQPSHKSHANRLWAAGGFAGAMGVHTYQAGIVTPAWVVGFLLHQLLFAPRRRWQNVFWTGLGMFMPLLAWAILIKLVPNLFFRIQAAGGGLPMTPGRLLEGYVGAFREFFLTGYPIPLYNTPNTPFLVPVLIPFAILGMVLAIWNWRKPGGALILGGMALFILPAGLSEDPTHPVRLIGTMPLLGLVTGWGVAWLATRVTHWDEHLSLPRGIALRTGVILIASALVIYPMASAHLSFQAMFNDPAEYDPPDGWFKVPHNYSMALTDALAMLEKVDQPTYVPISVLDTPIGGYVIQRQAFPEVTTWARYGLHGLPDGQYFFPVFGYYHTPAQDDDPCTALLLPQEHTIVILPCDLNAPIGHPAPGAQSLIVTNARGWEIARITPVAGRKLVSPAFDLADQGPEIGQGLHLIGQQTPSSIAPGQTASVLVYWRVSAPQPTDIYSVAQVISLDYRQFGSSDHHVLPYLYPSARWQVGDIIPDRHLVAISPELPDGIFRFGIGAHVPPRENRLAVNPANSALPDLWLWHPMRLPAPSTNTAIPVEATPLNARFDDHIMLAAYQLAQTESQWALTLYWRVDAPPQGDYTLFIHVQNQLGLTNLLTQQDARPLNGQLPTWAWMPGEVIVTTHILTIPAGAVPHAIYVGMYPYPSLQRLNVRQNGQPAADQRALIWSTP